MNKLVSVFLLLAALLSLFSCSLEVKEITCDELAEVYLADGYYVEHNHRAGESNYCNMIIKRTEDDKDYAYFSFYATEQEAEQAAKENEYNIAIWIFALPFGESRWLNSRCYGNIHYTYYDSGLVRPFEQLMRE